MLGLISAWDFYMIRKQGYDIFRRTEHQISINSKFGTVGSTPAAAILILMSNKHMYKEQEGNPRTTNKLPYRLPPMNYVTMLFLNGWSSLQWS